MPAKKHDHDWDKWGHDIVGNKGRIFSFSSRKLNIGFPLLLLVIGVYWLAKDMGWIETTISIWPILLIVFSIYWIMKGMLNY